MNDVSARANSCFLSCFTHSGKYKNNEEPEQNPALVLGAGDGGWHEAEKKRRGKMERGSNLIIARQRVETLSRSDVCLRGSRDLIPRDESLAALILIEKQYTSRGRGKGRRG